MYYILHTLFVLFLLTGPCISIHPGIHHDSSPYTVPSKCECWTSSARMGCGRSLWILRHELQYNCRALPWSFPAIWTESLVYWQNTGVGRHKCHQTVKLLHCAHWPTAFAAVGGETMPQMHCPLDCSDDIQMTSTWYGYQMSSLHVSSFLQLTSDSIPVSNQQSVASTEAARTKAFANKK